MKRNGKILSTTLALIMTAAVVTGCTNGTAAGSSAPASSGGASSAVSGSSSETAGEPAKYEGERKLSVWLWKGTEDIWGAKDFNEILAFSEMQKNANIEITWDNVSDFNVMVNSGQMCDLVWYNWNPERSQQFAKSGTIVDVAPIVKDYVPNLTAIYDKYDGIKKQMYTETGASLYFPWMTPENNMSEGIVLRKDYLEKIGKEVPKTPAEFEAVLTEMQAKDVNGNGKPDEVFSGYNTQMYKLFWGHGTTDDFMIKDNKVVFGPSMTEYRQALEWFAGMYSKNLLDRDAFSGDGGGNSDLQEIFKKHHVTGVSVGFIDNPGVVSDTIKLAAEAGSTIDYVPVPALQYNGKSTTIYSALKRQAQIYGLALTKSCDTAKYPLVGEWMNHLYSEENMNLFNWGIEGDTYTVVNGAKAYTDKIMKDPKWSPSVASSKYVYPSFMCITDPMSSTALLDDLGKACIAAWNDTDISMSYEPILFLTDDELKKTETFNKEFKTVKDEFRDKVVTGQIKMSDAEWNKFQETLKKIGLDDATAVRQAALERFNAK